MITYAPAPRQFRCPSLCPAGNACCLENDGALRHELHCCSDPACYCHSEQRFSVMRQDAPAERRRWLHAAWQAKIVKAE